MVDETSATERQLAVVILAAGKGTRMRSDLPKVAHTALGRSIIEWVCAASAKLAPTEMVCVVGHGADIVTGLLPRGVRTALQSEQHGTGHALACAMTELSSFDGDVLVVNGDGALFTNQTLGTVVCDHQTKRAVATALAITSPDDLPYGRIIRGEKGEVLRIVEAQDATTEELAVSELNAGVYCFDAAFLRKALPRLASHNAAGEQYITDLVGIACADGLPTCGSVAGDPEELLGINTREDLGCVEEILRDRVVRAHQRAGVRFVLPGTSLVEPTVQIAADAVIEPGCVLRGSTSIDSEAVVGPQTVLNDTRVGKRASVVQSHANGAVIGAEAAVGPFAYLRPGADLRESSKAGAFVEIKQSVIGPRSKVPHLSYIGDATVGADSNIGAGNITANFRPELGSGKQRTTIGTGVRTGSDNVFVAPITIGDGAFTGAGSIIVQDVPAGALAIARARQVNLQDYAARAQEEDAPRAGTT